MIASVRLDEATERELRSIAEAEGLTKSELVRQSVRQYLAARRQHRTAWEIGKDLFGQEASGRSDLSVSGESILRERLHRGSSRS